MHPCFLPADILLPNRKVDMKKWAVIACDQYTSQPEYWDKVADFVGPSDSSLHIIFPEAFLNEEGVRIESICETMKSYLENGVVSREITNGFILVERQVEQGVRTGLIGVIDLEQYDFSAGSEKPIRSTEGTVLSRIPPRVRIRTNAVLECPHVMLLIDDPEKKLIEPLAAAKARYRELYDFDLMLGGGNIKGFAVEGETAEAVMNKIYEMQREKGSFFLAAGDGNHSLATAKTCWENLKKGLSDEEAAVHPARFSMVEVINLHESSLVFEPIHRVIYNCSGAEIAGAFKKFLIENGFTCKEGDQVRFISSGGGEQVSIDGLEGRLPVDVLQRFLDEYAAQHPDCGLDYIHGENHVMELVQKNHGVGILLQPIDKFSLFPAIAAGGALPRKTFSIGEADEKRFYIECRKIVF